MQYLIGSIEETPNLGSWSIHNSGSAYPFLYQFSFMNISCASSSYMGYQVDLSQGAIKNCSYHYANTGKHMNKREDWEP